MLRLSQAQPRQSEENEGGKGHERDQKQSGRYETHQGVREKRVRFDDPSSAPASASDAAEDDGIQSKRTRGKDTRGRKIYVTKIWKGSGRQHDVQHVQTQRKEFQDDMLTTTSVAIESESCLWMKVPSELKVI